MNSKVFLAGHRGLVGSALNRALSQQVGPELLVRTRQELELADGVATREYLQAEKPDWVILAAAKVGGIMANKSAPADFIRINLEIQQSVILGAFEAGVQNLVFLSSSCVYPRITPQPIPEEALLTGPLEPTNQPYAIAKLAGMELCRTLSQQHGVNYFSVMPPNVFGPNDNFDPAGSHVLAALIRKFHEALPNQMVECWGTGTPRREFLPSDQLAEAILFLMAQERVEGHINVGTGQSISIKELAELVQRTVGHTGEIAWNTQYPDGFPEKTMDVTRLNQLGWRAEFDFNQMVKEAYEWFRARRA